MEFRSRTLRRLGAGFIALALTLVVTGCASDSPPLSAPILPLKPGGEAKLVRTVHLSLASGYEVASLRPGTTWQNVGSIPAGERYKPVDTVLSVDNGGYFNGTRFESELVVKDGNIVGVYLPMENQFVPTKEPVSNSVTGI